MTPVAIILMVIGLLGSIIAFFYSKNTANLASWWASVQETTANSLAKLPSETPVVLTGIVGTNDNLRDPLSNNPCVWYRYTVTEHWEERERNSEGEHTGWRNESRIISNQTSDNSFLLKDSAGVVNINIEDGNALEVGNDIGKFESQTERQDSGGMNFGISSFSFGNDQKRDHHVNHSTHFIPLGTQLSISGISTPNGVSAHKEHNLKVIKEDWRGLAEKNLDASKKSKMFIPVGLVMFVGGIVLLLVA